MMYYLGGELLDPLEIIRQKYKLYLHVKCLHIIYHAIKFQVSSGLDYIGREEINNGEIYGIK